MIWHLLASPASAPPSPQMAPSSPSLPAVPKPAILFRARRCLLALVVCFEPLPSPITNLPHPLRFGSIVNQPRKHPHLPVRVRACTHLQFGLCSTANQRKPTLEVCVQTEEASGIYAWKMLEQASL